MASARPAESAPAAAAATSAARAAAATSTPTAAASAYSKSRSRGLTVEVRFEERLTSASWLPLLAPVPWRGPHRGVRGETRLATPAGYP
jgi:hypothetical protein